MAKANKKSKEQKNNEIEKIKEYLKTYNTVLVIKNSSIQNICLQSLRSIVDGKVVFVKKTLLSKSYPRLNYEEDIFLVFTNDDQIDKIKEFEYKSFLEVGEKSPAEVAIPSGIIHNKRLAQLVKPVETKGANTHLLADFTVVLENEEVNEKSCEILKIKGLRLANKKLEILDTIESKDLLQ